MSAIYEPPAKSKTFAVLPIGKVAGSAQLPQLILGVQEDTFIVR
jgi:hypothetical protein